MIKLATTGGALIYSISPLQEIPSRNGGTPFQKRELVLDDSWTDRNGTLRPNYVSIEFTGERMQLLDNFQPGQRVVVEAAVNGRESNGRIFNSLRGLNITLYQPPQQQQQQGFGAPAYPQQGYPQQPAYQQPQPTCQPQAFPPQQPAPQSASFPGQPAPGGQDNGYGLPF